MRKKKKTLLSAAGKCMIQSVRHDITGRFRGRSGCLNSKIIRYSMTVTLMVSKMRVMPRKKSECMKKMKDKRVSVI